MSTHKTVELSQSLLHELFYLNEELGLFNKSFRSSTAKAGQKAGSTKKDGRKYVRIGDKLYLEHRLIWLFVYGYIPEFIDHIDQDPSNNALKNLRAATRSQNNRNVTKRKTNKSGYKGVYWFPGMRQWCAALSLNGQRIRLGFEPSKEDAAQLYNFHALIKFKDFAYLNGKDDTEAYGIWNQNARQSV